MSDHLHERGKALESIFFQRLDQQLLQDLRAEMEARESLEALEAASGIDDKATLEQLLKVGITAEALTSLSMVPLVLVAWSDGSIQEHESEAIMKAAATAGIVSDSASYQILQSWLSTEPGSELFESWKSYIGCLKETLDEASFAQLKKKVIDRARDVAEAAGGFLGVGSVSGSESKKIAELENSF